MFLIKTLFWIGLVILLLPTEQPSQQRLSAATVGALERALTFCDRNETLCQQGAQTWTLFKAKAEFGARLAMDLVSEHMKASSPAGQGLAPTSAPQPARGTLREPDLTPPWLGERRQTRG